MRLQSKAVLIPLGVVIVAAIILFAIHAYRHRFVRENQELLGLLPSGDVTTFYADLGALRSAGFLGMLSGAKPENDAEYKKFVRETGFDYTKDLDALAGSNADGKTMIAVRGRFDWGKLEHYATSHGGTCRDNVCELEASTRGRWISFMPIQPDVMAVALSENPSAVEGMKPTQSLPEQPMPSAQPVWVEMSESLLKSPLSLPLEARIFAVSLQSADHVIFSLAKSADPRLAAFYLRLDALCPNLATAEATRNQLEIQTKMLTLELAREHAHANPADLTGLLTAGAFQIVDKRVIGTWPVRKELLNTLE